MADTTTPDAAGTFTEAEMPDLTRLGRCWFAPDRGVAAVEILRDDGSDSGQIATVQPDQKHQDRFKIDIWQQTDLAPALKALFGNDVGERIAKAAQPADDKDPPKPLGEIIKTVPTADRPREYPSFGTRDADVALAGARDRLDRVRRGWCGADLDAARAEARVATLLADHDQTLAGDESRRQLFAADRAAAAGDLRAAASAFDRVPSFGGGGNGPDGPDAPARGRGDGPTGPTGPKPQRDLAQAKTWALETAHGSRSQAEWEAKLAERGYGLIAVSQGNKVEWQVRDLRSVSTDENGKATAKDFTMAELGFAEDAAPEKLRAAWDAGKQVDIQATLISEDVVSSSAPAKFDYDKDHAKLSAAAARADTQRNGLGRAMQSIIASVGDEGTWRKIDGIHQKMKAEAIAGGDKEPAITLDILSDRLAAEGMTFGSATSSDGTRRELSFVQRLARSEPPQDAKDHMQRWMSATTWAVQTEIVASGKAPSYEAFSEAMAAKGIMVDRSYDSERKQWDYSFTAPVAGVGAFSHSDKELGFDGQKDPRLSMHLFVETGEQVSLRQRAESAIERGNQRAEGIFNFTNRDRSIRESLAQAGLRTRIMAEEVVGKDADGLLIKAYRMGVEDIKTGRIMPADDLGVAGTAYIRQDGTKCDFNKERKVVQTDSASKQWGDFKSAFGQALTSFAQLGGGRDIDIWKSSAAQERATYAKPSVAAPSWERAR